MSTEKEIAENLLAAGCGKAEIESILSSIQKGDRKGMERLISLIASSSWKRNWASRCFTGTSAAFL